MTTTDPIANGHSRARRRTRPRPATPTLPTMPAPDPASVRAAVVHWWQGLERAVEGMLNRVHDDPRIHEAFTDGELRNLRDAAEGALRSICEAYANPHPHEYNPLPLFPNG